jgi:hypothetical protein
MNVRTINTADPDDIIRALEDSVKELRRLRRMAKTGGYLGDRVGEQIMAEWEWVGTIKAFAGNLRFYEWLKIYRPAPVEEV